MKLSRRHFMKVSAAVATAASLKPSFGQSDAPSARAIAAGPFAASRESLKAYQTPDWFADAKFGIWNHWGPQSAAEYGDWYARRMYVEGEPQYRHHLEHYGHPSKTGFADVIRSWKADKFDADGRLLDDETREKLAGALAALVAEVSPALAPAT